jgi:8-oxo-dGTP diphosphatase
MSLPGGWVGKGESVTDALRREIDEELGIEVDIGDLVCAAEVVDSSSRQDVELVFSATLRAEADAHALALIDPRGERAGEVLPPILEALADQHDARGPSVRWLGNVYAPGLSHLS